MLAVLALVVPLALAGAISPVMLSEQTLLLAGRDGRRTARCYAAGVAGTLILIIVVLLAFGRSISLPEDPWVDSTLDVVLGTLLVTIAAALRWWPHKPAAARARAPVVAPGAALALGVVSMATNVTTVALVLAAVKEISAADVDVLDKALVCVVLVTLVTLTVWVPLVLTRLAPRSAERALRALSDLIALRGRMLTELLLAALGVFLVVRGTMHLL